MQRLFNIFVLALCFFCFSQNVYAKEIKFIQVTDLMYRQNVSSQENLKNLVDNINSGDKIDFVVFTGDNIANAKKETLQEFLETIKSLKYPYYIELGEKDCLKANGLSKDLYLKYVKSNSKQKFNSFNYAVKMDDIVFVFVDGAKEFLPAPNGFYREDTLTWLDKTLTKYKKKHVIIIQHFPLFDKSEASPYNLYKADLYNEILSKHNNVLMIVSGHYRDNIEQEINNVKHIVTAPAADGSSNYREFILFFDKSTKQYEIYSHVEKFNR
ncbi:metallophosphoesterase [bacterium]|nr:metallophosphoesterase [bacterium]